MNNQINNENFTNLENLTPEAMMEIIKQQQAQLEKLEPKAKSKTKTPKRPKFRVIDVDHWFRDNIIPKNEEVFYTAKYFMQVVLLLCREYNSSSFGFFKEIFELGQKEKEVVVFTNILKNIGKNLKMRKLKSHQHLPEFDNFEPYFVRIEEGTLIHTETETEGTLADLEVTEEDLEVNAVEQVTAATSPLELEPDSQEEEEEEDEFSIWNIPEEDSTESNEAVKTSEADSPRPDEEDEEDEDTNEVVPANTSSNDDDVLDISALL